MTTSLPKSTLRIALVGDYNHESVVHDAIHLALDDAAAVLGVTADYDWIATEEINSGEDLVGYDAIWVVPGSPYKKTEGVLLAIRYAREQGIPFLGTCAGFQYVLIEYARNVMGMSDAAHAETGTGGNIIITPLSCPLAGKSEVVLLHPDTQIAKAYGKSEITEHYNCLYSVSEDFIARLAGQDLVVSGTNKEGEARVVELSSHPYFVATLFQHERSSLDKRPSPLVQGFLKAVRVI
ncbi:hypothetical protein A9B99_18535 [Mangrovibacter phragmitis]|uniref:CTP synthase (glutamine hydrolyzing) n=1 Tax=Mangrovibacter phragmitis TaxID=1691903 RepID=A0A1B7L736_9ENTR|nr:CTP synthase [Mangrovibacter phragmitis]OAT78138.1 hypothetical protein A9B99_18535 [Mangrovibacter phragmitis]